MHGVTRRKKRRSLVIVSKRRNVALDLFSKLRSVARRDDEIPCPTKLGGVEKPLVVVGREEKRVREARAQCLQDQELIVEIRPQDTDRRDLIALLAELGVGVLDTIGQSPKIIELSFALRAFKLRGPGTNIWRLFAILAIVRLGFVFRRNSLLAIEAAEVAEGMQPRAISSTHRFRKELGLCLAISDVPLANDCDVVFVMKSSARIDCRDGGIELTSLKLLDELLGEHVIGRDHSMNRWNIPILLYVDCRTIEVEILLAAVTARFAPAIMLVEDCPECVRILRTENLELRLRRQESRGIGDACQPLQRIFGEKCVLVEPQHQNLFGRLRSWLLLSLLFDDAEQFERYERGRQQIGWKRECADMRGIIGLIALDIERGEHRVADAPTKLGIIGVGRSG